MERVEFSDACIDVDNSKAIVITICNRNAA